MLQKMNICIFAIQRLRKNIDFTNDALLFSGFSLFTFLQEGVALGFEMFHGLLGQQNIRIPSS